MDEATSVLDISSQERLLTAVTEHLSRAAIISIAYQRELRAFNLRILVFAQPTFSQVTPALAQHDADYYAISSVVTNPAYGPPRENDAIRGGRSEPIRNQSR
jgi:ABC-type transport system involved in cytochrome bd biosynthesis fused ATPase/permease subunit